MKYSIKPKNDSDKENARQLELIMNHKFATYDDISEVIKEQVDNFEFKIPCIINGHEELISETESEIISFDQSVNDYIIEQLDDSETNKSIESLTELGMAANRIFTNELKGIHIQRVDPMSMSMSYAEFPAVIHENPFYLRNYASKDTVEIIDAILFQEQKQPKDNHPHGWYRKFEKKRY